MRPKMLAAGDARGNAFNRIGRNLPVLILLLAAFFILNPLLVLNEVLAEPTRSLQQLKEDAIAALQEISTTDKKLKRTITHAVKAIVQSLSDKSRLLFLDDSRILPPPEGHRVFQRERRAVDRLLKGIRRKGAPDEVKAAFQDVINDLVEADRRITGLSLAAAQKLIQVGEGNPRRLAKAKREYQRALQGTDPRKAIHGFKEAWKLSQNVVKGRQLGESSLTS